MSDANPTIDDPDLGVFARATSTLDDGTVLTHDWYARTYLHQGNEIELMLEGDSSETAFELLPHLHRVIVALDSLLRAASDAVMTQFSTGEPTPDDFDEAATDLVLEAIEISADTTAVLHFIDLCGEHFPEGLWPAVHLDADGMVTQVTVES